MDGRWSDEVEYAFSFNKSTMWLLGVWPLQKNDLPCKVRWVASIAMQVLMAVSYVMELQMECGARTRALETILIIECTLHGLVNHVFCRIHLKKLAVNVDAAIVDWRTEVHESSFDLMRRYARLGKTITMAQINIALLGGSFYYGSIILLNEITRAENETRRTVFASSCLAYEPSLEQYVMIMILQTVEIAILLTVQCGIDSFIVTITIHLCGQLEILRARFIEFGNKNDRREKYDCDLGSLVKRHCELISLAENIEDAFNIGILLQILMSVLALAFTSIRLMISLQLNDNVDTLKSIIIITFAIQQSGLVIYASDVIQTHSESIFHAISDMPWHDISPDSARNLIFIMVRSDVPIRYSAGKLFYISRVTMMDILKTSVSYMSVLKMSMKDLN